MAARRSLRFRLAALGAATVAAALTAAGFGLVLLFERHVERRLSAELGVYLDQLAAATAFDADGALRIEARLADPRFAKVYGGLYWQVLDERTGERRRSRSLWDQALALPADQPRVGEVDIHDLAGPLDAALLAHERRLLAAAPDGERALRFVVAVDRAEIDALTRDYAVEVTAALALLAALLVAASVLQLRLGLRPLEAVRRRVAEIRAGAARRLPGDAPREIEPLVAEMNALLAAHERSIEKARRRAADLAHGFNTPLTSLLNDARRLREKGEGALAGEIEATVRAMRRQIERELSQARAVEAMGGGAPSCAVAPVVEGLRRTLARTPQGERVRIEAMLADPALRVAAAEEDLAEILGNLMENALRHAASRMRVEARAEGGAVRFRIEDDGPGVAESQRAAILDRGLRLDRGGAGAGLGLAIVTDVLERYGTALRLETASIGGLAAGFELPAPRPASGPAS